VGNKLSKRKSGRAPVGALFLFTKFSEHYFKEYLLFNNKNLGMLLNFEF